MITVQINSLMGNDVPYRGAGKIASLNVFRTIGQLFLNNTFAMKANFSLNNIPYICWKVPQWVKTSRSESEVS